MSGRDDGDPAPQVGGDEDDDDVPVGNTTRILLSDYYGLQNAAPPPANDGGSERDRSPRQNASDDTGSVRSAPITSRQPSSIMTGTIDTAGLQSTSFNVDEYVGHLLHAKGMRDLVELDTDMRASVRSLDSDMQMLVYENYNKFISATDMIRKMKDNVESMENQMDKLLINMDSISKSTVSLETVLNPNRAKVEKLVGVSRLIKRLEFLFELPLRLRQSIELGAHAQAVKYFTKANLILRQYMHIASFEKIHVESEQIMDGLKVLLRKQLRDPASKSLSQMENSALLIQLGEAPEALLQDLFASRRSKLQEEMRAATESVRAARKKAGEDTQVSREPSYNAAVERATTRRANALREMEEQQRVQREREEAQQRAVEEAKRKEADNAGDGASPAKPKPDESAATAELLASPTRRSDAGSETKSADTKTADAAAGDRRKGKEEKKEAKPKGKEAGEAQLSLIVALNDAFLESFILFAQSFVDTFIKPSATDKASRDSVAKCKQGLTDFTKDMFNEYFSLVRKELLDMAERMAYADVSVLSSVTEALVAADAATSGEPGQPVNASGIVLPRQDNPVVAFITTLKYLYQSLIRPSSIVPLSRLNDRAEEIIRHAIRSAVESVFQRVHNNVVLFTKSVLAEMELDSAAPNEEGVVTGHPSPQTISRLARASPLVRKEMEDGVNLLVPILVSKDYLPDAMGSEFGDLAHGHMQLLLQSVSSFTVCGFTRESEGPVYKQVEPSLLKDVVDLAKQKHPEFFLVMAEICMDLQATDLLAALKYIKKRIPSGQRGGGMEKPSRKTDAGIASSYDSDVSKLITRLRENAQILLQAYTDTHGDILARLVYRTNVFNPKTAGEVMKAIDLIRGQLAAVLGTKTGGGGTSPTQGGAGGAARGRTLKGDGAAAAPGPGSAGAASAMSPDDRPNPVGAPAARGRPTGVSREMSLKRDMEKIFTQRLTIYGPVKRNRQAPLLGVLKIFVKSVIETIRALPAVSMKEYMQVQSTVAILKGQLPAELSQEDNAALEQMLEEALSSASDRCAAMGGSAARSP